ncbi:MAG: PEGA domain-containing protein [Candidatus Daviesbacteria bacterium]|nr:PEGA domain-containing protein [Candidatus Daviesbacteria bacterium]
MSKRVLFTVFMIVIIFGASGIAILFAKGYTFSTSQKRIIGTGIISATSEPDSASVFIDGHLTTATNATISSLPPKKYAVKIVKEGFIPWEKEVEVREGLVSELKVTLFPAIPTIYPLTYNGVKNPTLSPDASKLVFVVPSGKKAGVWVWTMARNQPIAFARSSEPHQISLTTGAVDFTNSAFKWSPDSKQIIATIGNEQSSSSSNNYLLDSESLNNDPRDITPTLTSTLKSWSDDLGVKDDARLLTIKDLNVRNIASQSALLRWSPDETKLFYVPTISVPNQKSTVTIRNTEASSSGAIINGAKVYDLETRQSYDLPSGRLLFWLSDSRHIVLVENGTVSIIDFDGSNKAIIYAGNFLNDFVFAWPDASRLVLMSTFPTPTASEPNLYGINLK